MELLDFYRTCAPFYDRDYAGMYEEGVQLYVELARESGGPVLEMGCGTGRVLLPTARAGIAVCGMELSPDMLDVARRSAAAEPEEVQRRVKLVPGDIRCDSAGSRFPLITAPFRVAQHLLERADQRAWLRNVKWHLFPGGFLCFDVFQVDPGRLAEEGKALMTIDRIEPETGCRVRRFDTLHSFPALQLIGVHVEWVEESASGERVSATAADCTMRWFTRAELENLLELEGFEITDYWGSFDRRPFGHGAQQQIIRARLSDRASARRQPSRDRKRAAA